MRHLVDSHLSPCFLRDFEIPNTARLKFINEPMHRQILPSPGSRFAHRSKLVKLFTCTLMLSLMKLVRISGCGGPLTRLLASSTTGVRQRWRTVPIRGRQLVTYPKLSLRRHSLGGRLRRLMAPDQMEASREPTHCARYSGYSRWRMRVPRARLMLVGGDLNAPTLSRI